MNNQQDKLIGDRLKSARMQLGYSRREIAQLSNFSAATLQAWEDGKYSVPPRSLAKYTEALLKLGLVASIEWFTTGEGLPPRPASNFLANSTQSSLTIKPSFPEEEIILREIYFFEKENKNALVFTITDDSMLPFFAKGDHVGGNLLPPQFAQKCLGEICIITIGSGETFVRKLKPGSQANHFNLISTNADTEVDRAYLLNCEIQKIAPVIWHRKGKGVSFS